MQYTCSDLYLAAYLKAHGIELLDYSRDVHDPRRVNFSFQDSLRRKELHREFYNGGIIEIRSFINAIKDLKSLTRNM